MKKTVLLLAALFISACGAKESSLKSYEYYFPPLDKGEGYSVYETSETLDSSEEVLEEDISSVREAPSGSFEKSVCKAKKAPGPKKIGKPYKINGTTYYPMESADGYTETGVASWYGPGFHGKLTANGEKYNQKAMTAAHKTLPLPTLVRVRNLENGREIIVRVNDRGPYSKGRIIDLTEEGARRLGMLHKGTAKVAVSVLSEDEDCYVTSGREVDINAGDFAVQIGAFGDPTNASRLASRFGRKAVVSKKEESGTLWNRVWLTGYASRSEAEDAAGEYSEEFPGAFVIRYE